MVFNIVFWILAVISVIAALSVVLLRDVFRAAMALILLFLTVAGIYVTLNADFLAVVQVLVYVGAISILLVVAIMLTRDATRGSPSGRFTVPAVVVGIILLFVLVFSLTTTFWNLSSAAPPETTVEILGEKLFGAGGYLLQVQIVAILLLTAVLGAVVLLREK